MDDNPYSPPLSESPVNAIVINDESFGAIAKRVFLAWEKLRPIYLAPLVAVTLMSMVATGLLFNRRLWKLIVEGAVVANVLYFAGPAMETYIRWLGYGRTWPRWFLFAGGMLFSLTLAIFALAAEFFTELLPDQD